MRIPRKQQDEAVLRSIITINALTPYQKQQELMRLANDRPTTKAFKDKHTEMYGKK